MSTLAANLTSWGYQDCQRDMSNGGGGGGREYYTQKVCIVANASSLVPKLLLRHLPRHFPWVSFLDQPLSSFLSTDVLAELCLLALSFLHAFPYEGKPNDPRSCTEIHI